MYNFVLFSIIDACFEGINLSRSFALNCGSPNVFINHCGCWIPFQYRMDSKRCCVFPGNSKQRYRCNWRSRSFCVYFYESTEYRQRFVLNTIVVLLFLSRLQLYCVFVCNSQIQHASPGIVMVNVLENLVTQAVLTVFI